MTHFNTFFCKVDENYRENVNKGDSILYTGINITKAVESSFQRTVISSKGEPCWRRQSIGIWDHKKCCLRINCWKINTRNKTSNEELCGHAPHSIEHWRMAIQRIGSSDALPQHRYNFVVECHLCKKLKQKTRNQRVKFLWLQQFHNEVQGNFMVRIRLSLFSSFFVLFPTIHHK